MLASDLYLHKSFHINAFQKSQKNTTPPGPWDPPTAPSPLVDLLIDAVIMAVALVLGGGISNPAGRYPSLASPHPHGDVYGVFICIIVVKRRA